MADTNDSCATMSLNHKYPDGGVTVPRRQTGSDRRVMLACLRSLGLAAAVAVYVVVGAFVFRAIESRRSPPSTTTEINGSPDNDSQMERELLQKIWTITGEMNVLYEDAWFNRTQVEFNNFMQRERMKFAEKNRKQHGGTAPHEWTLPMAVFYSYATITTIGSRIVVPRTALGMATTVMYAILGTPLLFYFLICTGKLLADGLRHLVRRCRCFCRKPTPTGTDSGSDDGANSWPSVRVFLPVTVLLLFGLHVLVGGLLLVSNGTGGAGGDLATGMYVIFCAVFTLGLADAHPVSGALPWPRDLDSCLVLIGFSAAGMLIMSVAVHLIFERPSRCDCKDKN